MAGQRVIRLGVDRSTGHGCFPPTVPSSASPDVYANQIAMVRLTDTYVPHCCKTCHTPVATVASGTVFVNQLGDHRDGDGHSCGESAANGSPDVFAGS
jgi:uncharacterized Zn-binding protein involved in type VI secretion